MSAELLCPSCAAAWPDCAEVSLGHGVAASHDPEGRARIELVVRCDDCEAEFYAFVALDALQQANG